MSNNTARQSTVAIATVFVNLINKVTFKLDADGAMVLEALQRANPEVKEMSVTEIGDYLSGMSEESLRGLANNVKGIYHELQFVNDENTDGDDISARLYPETNHPGADVILSRDGSDFDEIQLKATDSISTIQEHYNRYPDVSIVVTSELADKHSGIGDSGFSNDQLDASVLNTFEHLENQGTLAQYQNAGEVSALMSGAINAANVISGKKDVRGASIETLKDVGIAVSTTALIDILFF